MTKTMIRQTRGVAASEKKALEPYRAKPFVFWAVPVGEFVKVECCRAEDVERERKEHNCETWLSINGCPHDEMRSTSVCNMCGWIDWHQRAENAEKRAQEAEARVRKLEDVIRDAEVNLRGAGVSFPEASETQRLSKYIVTVRETRKAMLEKAELRK